MSFSSNSFFIPKISDSCLSASGSSPAKSQLPSTFKSRTSAQAFSFQTTSNVLTHTPASMLNISRFQKLRTQKSKLHLIDSTTLTSLPFAPPPPTKRLKRQDSSSSRITNYGDTESIVSGFSAIDVVRGPVSASTLDLQGQIGNLAECTFNEGDETFDETLDEAQEPIVLVEDYMCETLPPGPPSKETMFRKESLANIKKRLRDESSRSSLNCSSSSSLAQNRNADVLSTQHSHPATKDELEAIFGKLPGTDKLKYCTLCDKPLYEISSMLSNSLNASGKDNGTNVSQYYQEFVCWECIVTYEQVLTELHEAEAQFARESSSMSTSGQLCAQAVLTSYSSDCNHTYSESQSDGHITKKRKFSHDLISRLQHLSEISKPRGISASEYWLSDWQSRLKSRLTNILSNVSD